MDLRVEHLANIPPEQERQFWAQCERDVDSDTGEATRAHLARRRSYQPPPGQAKRRLAAAPTALPAIMPPSSRFSRHSKTL
jgi:hypothetical protein